MRNYQMLTEEELVQQLRKGDEKAFAETYNRYWEKLLAIGFYHIRDKEAAEDVVHDVMMSLWTRRNHLKIDTLNAYLATAVKFSVFKAIARDKKKREFLNRQNVSAGVFDIEEKLDAKFLKEYLQTTVERLPEKTKLVFSQSRSEGLTITEIAHKLDLSPKAVEYHITKALRAIRNRLQKIKYFFV